MKKFEIATRLFTILIVLFLCFGFSPEQSRALASPAPDVSSGPDLEGIKRDVVIPIGPVTALPGSTLTRTYSPPDLSYIGKAAALELTISGIDLPRFTNVYWGPQDLGAIQHALAGGLGPDRALTYFMGSSNLSGGSAYFSGDSPSNYPGGLTGTRFRLLTLNPMVLASSVNIPDAEVVLPITGGGLSAQLQFQTFNGSTYLPSNDYFNNVPYKSSSLSGSILSSFTDAFWYTAPDVEVAIQSYLDTYCLGTYATIQVTASNHGPGIATEISVSGTLPPEWEFVSYSASPCGIAECYNPSTGAWTVGDLPEGNGSMLSIRVKLIGSGLASLTEVKTQYQVDPICENNSATLDLTSAFCSFMPTIIR